MKTVYINEKILESEEFKKSILMDTLPDDVIVKMSIDKDLNVDLSFTNKYSEAPKGHFAKHLPQ